MLPPEDTIVAVATPIGRSALGVVRVSGARALDIARHVVDVPRLEPRRATTCRALVKGARSDDVSFDEAVVVWFPAPRSYTGEHVVEISTHGNPLLLEGVVRSALAAGARLARPGEFTLRAVVNGKRTLVEAEAVADLIEASTMAQARLAFDQLHGTFSERMKAIDAELLDVIAQLEASLDFPDEGYHFIEDGELPRSIEGLRQQISAFLVDASRGRLLREGATVAIVGRPNVGKSSLFNALIGSERAIVAASPGTTRDLLTERVDIAGVVVTLVDSAGIRASDDPVEQEGVARSARVRGSADLIVLVLDASQGMTPGDVALAAEMGNRRCLQVWNKIDLVGPSERSASEGMCLSARTGTGLEELRARILRDLAGTEPLVDTPGVANVRHIDVLRGVDRVLGRVQALTSRRAPEEIVLRELRAARERLDELVGARTSEHVLARVFERFCVGK